MDPCNSNPCFSVSAFSPSQETWASPVALVVKNLPANAEDTGSIPRSRRSPKGGNGNPLQFSCLENTMDRVPWRATVHGATVWQDWATEYSQETVTKKATRLTQVYTSPRDRSLKHHYSEQVAKWSLRNHTQSTEAFLVCSAVFNKNIVTIV